MFILVMKYGLCLDLEITINCKVLDMNRFLLIILFLAAVVQVMSQEVPQTVVFSAVVHNSDNEIVANTSVDLRLTFLEGGQSGTPIYCEEHRAMTNSIGRFMLKLNRDVLSCGCNGTSVLSFEDIPWTNGNYWMQVEYRTEAMANYSSIGIIELASSFYALVADKAMKLTEIDFYIEGVRDGDVLGYNETTRRFEPVTLAHDPEVPLSEVLAAGNSADGMSIVNLSSPVAAHDAVTKSYLDSLVSVYVDIVDSLGGQLTVFPEGHNGVYRNHEYVDLGLPSGTMWATCNVGALTPEDCGDRFAWGETQPKDVYIDSTYTYYENPVLLPSSHDAAAANWGYGWKIPTRENFIELMTNCAWRWTTINGVNGYIVSSFNGNSIFLPACASRYDGYFIISKSAGRDAIESGSYWLSTMGQAPAETPTGFFMAPHLFAISRWSISYGTSDYINYREVGQTVRPVYNP